MDFEVPFWFLFALIIPPGMLSLFILAIVGSFVLKCFLDWLREPRDRYEWKSSILEIIKWVFVIAVLYLIGYCGIKT